MKFSKFLFAAAASAIAMFAVSCEKSGGEKTEEETYTLELADPADADIVLNDSDAATFKIGIKTSLKKEQLKVYEKNGETWCDASVESADSIKITPGANFTEEDITATFVVSAIDGINVTPVEFKVTRRGTTTEYYVKIESAQISDGGYGTFLYKTTYKSAEDLIVTVETNAARWYFSEYNQVTDDQGNPVEWYTVDKKSGRNGETVTVKFSDNNTKDDRISTMSFQFEENGWEGPSINVTQYAVPATSVKISVDGKPVEGKTYDVVFEGDNKSFSFDMEKDGSVAYKWVKPGTDEVDASAEEWISISNYAGWNISHWSKEPKSVDLVFTATGSDTELFRFKITVK